MPTLRQLAEAALSQMYYSLEAHSHGTLMDGTENPHYLVSGYSSLFSRLTKAEAKFLEASGPQAILALLDRLDALEECLRDIPGGWIGRMAASLTRFDYEPETDEQRALSAWLNKRKSLLKD